MVFVIKQMTETLNLEQANRCWLTVLSEFSNQLQVMVWGMWTVSFTLMTNLTKLDRVKDVLEQFNKISLDPTGTLLQNMDINLFIDDTDDSAGLKAYVEKEEITRMGGALMGAPSFGDGFTLSVVYANREYTMQRGESDLNEFYSFSTIQTPTTTLATSVEDHVLVNGTRSRIKTRLMTAITFKEAFLLGPASVFTCWSHANDGQTTMSTTGSLEPSPMKNLAFEKHLQFMMLLADAGATTIIRVDNELMKLQTPDNTTPMELFELSKDNDDDESSS
jgi:hypothetical protein